MENQNELLIDQLFSINKFLAFAAAEKMSELLTEEYIEARDKRSGLKKFRKYLKKYLIQNRKTTTGGK